MADHGNQAGYFLSLISQQMGLAKNDFLRQVIGDCWKKFCVR